MRHSASEFIAGTPWRAVDRPRSPPYIHPTKNPAERDYMPWDNNTGGGGRNNNGGGPWGQTPGGGGGRPTRREWRRTPSLEDILNRGRDRFQGGGGIPGGRWAIVGRRCRNLVVFWLFNSIYTINEGEVGVELQFGGAKPELSQPGLHFHWWPVEDVERASIALRLRPASALSGTRNEQPAKV